MNKIAILITLLALAGHARVHAQTSGAGKGQAGASPVNNAPKAKTGQTEGKGVPFSKDKKTQQRSVSTKPVPPSSVGTEPDASARATGKISPGSHGVQRDQRADFKATKKPGSQSAVKQQ